jgi:arabinogalactan endo-1,4-beta-galactosidase
MRISDQFPSDYLRAVDLDNKEITVTMTDVRMEQIGEDNKPVLYFQGKEKGMVLNKTNAASIANLYGDDTTDWTGEAITLFSAMVSFQGKTVPAIRVKPPSRKAAAKKPAAAPAPAVDDEIPF